MNKTVFDNFLTHYNESKVNRIWDSNMKQFNEFWAESVGRSEELRDTQIDEIVKILDRHGKGNRKGAEAIAKVMIPQGAWRRLF